VTLGVQFGPTTAGGITGQLAITSDSSTGATTMVQLSGTGTTATTPQLLFSSTALSFGNVTVGSTATLSLRLISSGTSPVTVNTAALTGTGFSNSGTSFPVVLNPDQSVTLELQFDPTAETAATGQLTIKSDSTTGSTTQISLSGTGTAVQHTIELTWDAPSTSPDPVAGYNVFRSIDNGTSFTKVNSSVGAQTDYTDSDVQSGATYIYQVTSVDASDTESSPSNRISLTIP
jgi:Abnormal spindle-like microcephaly-assoc'd, ASPM-SPD-2-Hydin